MSTGQPQAAQKREKKGNCGKKTLWETVALTCSDFLNPYTEHCRVIPTNNPARTALPISKRASSS
jgi:hypothetical protein